MSEARAARQQATDGTNGMILIHDVTRPPFARVDVTRWGGNGLESAYDGGAHGDDAISGQSSRVDPAGRGHGDSIELLVWWFGALQTGDAGVKDQRSDLNSHGHKLGEQLRRERAAG